MLKTKRLYRLFLLLFSHLLSPYQTFPRYKSKKLTHKPTSLFKNRSLLIALTFSNNSVKSSIPSRKKKSTSLIAMSGSLIIGIANRNSQTCAGWPISSPPPIMKLAAALKPFVNVSAKQIKLQLIASPDFIAVAALRETTPKSIKKPAKLILAAGTSSSLGTLTTSVWAKNSA